MPCSLPNSSLSLITIFFLLFCSSNVANATVPPSRTFKYINEGGTGELSVEYFADYRALLFDGDDYESLCNLPRKCGSLGICEDNQCVACPKPKGLMGWSESCAPPVLSPCKGGGDNVGYYKVVGVEHFTNEYTEGDGPVNLNDCRVKCSNDCGCLGFFYKEESSKCLLVPELGTLVKVTNLAHVAYIKMPQ